jgi:hypothetical protein
VTPSPYWGSCRPNAPPPARAIPVMITTSQMNIRCSDLASLIALAMLAACGDNGTRPEPDTSVARVILEAPRTALSVGGMLQLSGKAENAAGKVLVGETIDWTSSRPDVATITSAGLVSGVASGSTVITAASGGRKATVTLYVQPPGRITLASDAGDFVGAGRTYGYTKADATIQLTATGTYIRVGIVGDERWQGEFVAPSGFQLISGTVYTATRSGPGASMTWFGEGRGCNAITGIFVVDSLRWDAGNGALEAIALRFEQHCEGGAAALRGSIMWRADDPTSPPGPVLPIPSTLWRPPAGAVPAGGNVVYLQSDSGDPIGEGATALYPTSVSLSTTGRTLTAWGADHIVDFEAMISIPRVQVGYYADLRRFPVHNPARGGLSVAVKSRACSAVSGWVAVDRVNYAGGLAGIEMRFEQHCGGIVPAIRGMVRWGVLPS